MIESDPDWIRTNDPQLRRLMLYPTELPDLEELYVFGDANIYLKLFGIVWGGCMK